MPLTNAQIQTLKTFVTNSADPAIVTARQTGATYDLSILLNQANSPTTLAWKANVEPVVLDDAATYTTFDSLTQGKRDEWGIFLRFNRDMSKAKNRNVVTDVWGNATAGSVSEAILQAATENATVAQVAIGGNTRTTGTVSALARNYTDLVTEQECQKILAA